ncbi:MAG: hypothetical protein VKO21_11085 [Candidatus Sericytochromatia bacterium]|nr:hypothetical protein [Candidatus Sericytochromatia bacterium]
MRVRPRTGLSLLVAMTILGWGPSRAVAATEQVWLEDGGGRELAERPSGSTSPWSERTVWWDGTWLWSAYPVPEPEAAAIRNILPNLQDNIIKLGIIAINQHDPSTISDTHKTSHDEIILRLRRHFDEGAIRQVRYAGGPGAWQAQVAYDVRAFEDALGFRALTSPPRPQAPDAREEAAREEQRWKLIWEGLWLGTVAATMGLVILIVDATVKAGPP